MLKETEFLNLKKKNYQANIRHEALEQKKKEAKKDKSSLWIALQFFMYY